MISADTTIGIPSCLDVPNVFTPNGDGINDILKIEYFGEGVVTFRVFTRAGVLIYTTQGTNVTYWDGRLESGELVSTGIYYYTIEIKGGASPISRKGFFYVFY